MKNTARHMMAMARWSIAATAASLLYLHGDAPLETALGLNMDQAREVIAVQAKYRPKFAAKRQEHNAEMRRLRRARLAKDSRMTAELEKTTTVLHDELQQIRRSEDDEIRGLLQTPEQRQKFAAYLKLRKEMVGSSRDDDRD